MLVNSNKPQNWKADIAQSVDFYNDWFIRFAPKAYRTVRVKTTKSVEHALKCTDNLMNITPNMLVQNPSVLPILRMATAPPIARDRLIGLSQTSPNLVKSMEIENRIPPRMSRAAVNNELQKICEIFIQLADIYIFPWMINAQSPTNVEVHRAATIVADRLCGSMANPIIRNAQEQRQLAAIEKWLKKRGYSHLMPKERINFDEMQPGTFTFRLNVPITLKNNGNQVNIPVDAVIMPFGPQRSSLPLLIEAKSAGDFTNPNKRRKEEATKVAQLKNNYGDDVRFVLFLCGYFDSGYLGYEAAEDIDWIWEHRIDDLAKFGV